MIPTISVVIPTFDRPHLLQRAINSVLNQSSPADEILVVDNGTSPLATNQIQSPAQLIRIEARAGVSAARNRGASDARAEWVAFLDDDDRWDERYLEEIRRAITSHGTQPDVVVGRNDREVGGAVRPYKQITTLEGLRSLLMVKNPGVGGQNLVARRAFLASHGGFRVSLHGPEDRAFLIDALDKSAVIALAPKAVAIKIDHAGQQITDGARALQSTWRFTRLYWSTMTPRQRRKNLTKLRNALLKRFRPRLGRRLLAEK